ncbi:MAG: glycine zipper family protein [Actinomycetota bacterium]|nr:glycine zipper family protein [Actinomycetota bacterium]
MTGTGKEVTGRRSVATFNRYSDAQRAVDFLSDERFPVQHVSIVGEDLRIVEDVTGRKGYRQAASGGAASGAIVGALIGLTFGLILPVVSAVSLGLYWLVVGAIAGALVGLVSQALTRGRRDFASIGRVEASSYHIVVDGSVADKARSLLERLAASPEANR